MHAEYNEIKVSFSILTLKAGKNLQLGSSAVSSTHFHPFYNIY